MAVKQIPAFESLENVKDTVIPILWFDEGMDELGPELREAIGEAVIEMKDSIVAKKSYLLSILGLLPVPKILMVSAVALEGMF